MTKTLRVCNMCGKQPGDTRPKAVVIEGESVTVSAAMPPLWITLDHPGAEENDVVRPGTYDLCSEACMRKLVAGEAPLNENDFTVQITTPIAG